MQIINVATVEFGVKVTATAEGKEESFYVELVDNKYRVDLGCWITTDTSNKDINTGDYSEFDVSEIINVAEKHAHEEFENNYEEKEIEFNCLIDSCSVYMRIEKATFEVELVIKNVGAIGIYQRKYKETGVKFDSKDEAEAYTDKFSAYQDCTGLNEFIQDIQRRGLNKWFDLLDKPDVVYSSKVFTYSEEDTCLPHRVEKGGSGHDLKITSS